MSTEHLLLHGARVTVRSDLLLRADQPLRPGAVTLSFTMPSEGEPGYAVSFTDDWDVVERVLEDALADVRSLRLRADILAERDRRG